MESFQELPLPAFLHESLRKMKFEKPTPIQAQAIPPGLEGKDVVASAETGSGKTAAFGIPLLNFLAAHPNQTALILTPTRELADQVKGVLEQLASSRHDLRSALLIGGVGMGQQVDALKRGARLIIGTPGRINDHLEHRTLNLSRTGFLVLDEADRMLDMGFAPQLDRIRRWLTGPRQTVLFSATLPPDIQKMAALYLKDPVRIAVGGDSKPVEKIQQKILHTSQSRKFDDLEAELRSRQGSVLIFVRTQHRVDRLARQLKEKNFEVTRIHGGRTQGQRRIALDQFKNGAVRILVATDIAARGLDVQNIAHVVNYDLPMVPEDYVHRVGRTARAGAEGDSLSLVTPEDHDLWRDVLKALGSSQSSIITIPSHFKDHAASQSPSSHHPQGHPQGRPQGRPQGQGGRSNYHSNPHDRREGSSQGPSGHRPTQHSGTPNRSSESEPQRHQSGSSDPRHRQSPNHEQRRPQGSSPHHRENRQDHPHRSGGNRDENRSDRQNFGRGDTASTKVKRWFKRLF